MAARMRKMMCLLITMICSMYANQGPLSLDFPRDINKSILEFATTNTNAESLQEAANLLSQLICVNKFTHMYMDDDDRALQLIKDLSKKFNCSNMDVARALRTRTGKFRFVIQSGLWLNNAADSTYVTKYLADLKTRGLDVNFSYDIEYQSPLLQCFVDVKQRKGVARWLIANGADINICCSNGMNPSMIAACAKSRLGISLVKHKDLKIDHQDNKGNTLLHYCSAYRCNANAIVIRQLLARGPNPTLKNEDGKTALQLAKKVQYKPVIIKRLKLAMLKFELEKNKKKHSITVEN